MAGKALKTGDSLRKFLVFQKPFPSPEAVNLEIPYPVQSLCQDGSSQFHQCH